MQVPLKDIIQKYKQGPAFVYNSWFIGSEERLKGFRSIRRCVHASGQFLENCFYATKGVKSLIKYLK